MSCLQGGLDEVLALAEWDRDAFHLRPGERSGMHDVAEFLKAQEPFSGLDEAKLDRLAERAKVEFFTAGTTIFKQGRPPPDEIRVIRRGAVELVDRGRVLDLLEDGEMFGQAWMFSGLPHRVGGAGPRGHALLRPCRGGRGPLARAVRPAFASSLARS